MGNIIDTAKNQVPNLEVGCATAVKVSGADRGALKGRTVIVVHIPKGDIVITELLKKLSNTYQAIFNQFEGNGELNIPGFNMGPRSAETAIHRALDYIKEHQNATITFVFSNDNKGKETKKYFQQALQRRKGQEELKRQIKFKTGDITRQKSGVIVMPVGKEYTSAPACPVADKINKLVSEAFSTGVSETQL